MNNKLASFIIGHYKKYINPVLNTPEDGISYWRERALLEIIFLLFVSAVIAYIPSVILSLSEELWLIAIVDTAFYAFLTFLFFNKKLSVKFRVYSLLILNYLLGVLLVTMLGPYGAGYLWMFIIPILAATLIEKKTAVVFLVLNFVSLILLGIFQYYISPVVDYTIVFSAASWLVITANFIFLSIIITFSVVILITGLQQKLENEKEMISSLEKRNKEIIEAKEEAEKADKLKTEFLAQISHEIRTPINTILGFTNLIKSRLNGSKDDEMKESFNLISSASKRLTRTIDLILNMAEIQTESFKPAKRNFDLYHNVFHTLLEEYRFVANEKGLLLSVENKLDKNVVYADEYTVSQIFANLIDNAIKYTDHGNIRISLFNELDKVVVDVEDTGIGISKNYLKNIFTPFSQEYKGYTRKYDGNGLGLALVKRYCEINNADIEIQSEKSIGTKVTVSFHTKQESYKRHPVKNSSKKF